MVSKKISFKNQIRELQEENRELKNRINVLRIAKNQLEESEDKLRTILENTIPAFVLHDFEGKILMVNNHVLKLTGYSREEFLQKNISEIALEIDPMEHRQEYWEKLEIGKNVKVYGMHKRKDDSVFPAEIMLVRLNLKEKPVIAAFARDISKHREIVENLSISKETFQLITDNANDLICIRCFATKRVFGPDNYIVRSPICQAIQDIAQICA